MTPLAFLALTINAPPDDSAFEKHVRPVLVESCVKCHGPDKASGGLRVDSRDALLKGGDSGPAVVPGKPAESRLMKAVRRAKDVEAMPPDKPLAPAAVAALDRWIAAGAAWPATAAPVAAAKHWAFQPVRPGNPPTDQFHPIDAFLAARQRERGVTTLGPADPGVLVRRMTFDLTGLPPTPAQVDEFVRAAATDRPTAVAKLIDRLLASPAYGEKWGRKWLDVVRYADTAGETADFPVPDAWRYRNYVIAAFNADKPYPQFLIEQLAGDLLAPRLPPDTPADRVNELLTATGYIAVARRFGFDVLKDHFLTIEDTIDTVGKSVLGLTIGCARCHDHKYDPISAADYYALYGIFESTKYPNPGCEKTKVPADLVDLRPMGDLAKKLAAAQAIRADRERQADTAAKFLRKPRTELATGNFENGGQEVFAGPKLKGVAVRKGEMIGLTVWPKGNHGADSTLVELEVTGGEKTWNLTRDLVPDFHQGGAGARHADGHGNAHVWYLMEMARGPRLFTEFVRDALKTPGLQVWRGSPDWPSALVNTAPEPVKFQTVTQPGKSFALHPGPHSGVAVAWASPIDGTVDISGRVADLDASGGDGIIWALDHGPGMGDALAAFQARDAAREEVLRLRRLIPQAYAVQEGSPHDAQLHKRGDPDTRGPAVPRRFLKVLGGQPLPAKAGSGRLELAGWLTDSANPLTARVMVNRVWQGHFGRGLVETPNDFGTRGSPPTHPELLDWLADRFVQSGWSVKAMHRLILTSAAYQRSSSGDIAGDPNNLLLARFDRRRLDAEEIRDALLAVSGDLDPSPGGPHPFPAEKTWGFTQHAPFAAVYDTNRRSVYLMTQRIKRHPFLALFDGPDPNASSAARGTSTVPTQALYFLNDPFVHARADRLAARLTGPTDDRLDQASRLLFGRPVTAKEREVAGRYFAAGGTWAGWARVLFGSNEFVYVD